MATAEPGIYYDMPFAEYCALDAVNVGSLVHLLDSPKAYKWHLEHPIEDTPGLRMGRAVHTAVLEPERFLADYCLCEYDSYRTKAAKEWKAEVEASGKTPLKQDEYDKALAIAKAARSHPVAGPILCAGDRQTEVTVVWRNPETGIVCKARIDLAIPEVKLADLKTSSDVLPRHFCRTAARLSYHVKAGWYRNAWRIATGQSLPFKVVSVATTAPYDCVVYDVPETLLWRGESIAAELLERLAQLRKAGHWPGLAEDGEIPMELPPWALDGPDGDDPDDYPEGDDADNLDY